MMDRYETGYERHTMDLDPQGDWVDYDIVQARIGDLEAALTWYGAQVYLFANDTTEKADEADVALDQDGGKRARAALGDGA